MKQNIREAMEKDKIEFLEWGRREAERLMQKSIQEAREYPTGRRGHLIFQDIINDLKGM